MNTLTLGTGVFFRVCDASWDNGHMPKATINVDAALKARLADLAGQTGQRVDEFVDVLLRRIVDADVHRARRAGLSAAPRSTYALGRRR